MARSSRASTGRLADQTGWIGSIARFWEKSYAPDYVGLGALTTGYILIIFFVEPFHRLFFINNINLQYPHALVERVPVFWNITYAGFIPCGTLVVLLAATRASFHKFHVTILGLLISIMLTLFVTDVIKNAVGRPRPDLIARCKPAPGTPVDVLVNYEVCTETGHHTLHDGWRSFPSGHSSFSFSGLGYTSLYFAGQMHVYRPGTDLARALIALSPLLGALMIGISRCEDYRHDVYDVTCGSIIGMGIAYFSYRRYYPRLHSAKCHEPYPSRETKFNEGFGKLKNDEETARTAREFDLSDNDDDNETLS